MPTNNPTLSGFGPSVTFTENTVNDAPQLLDTNVTFFDANGDFDGGTLTLTGILAEDTVSVRDQGDLAFPIGLNGSNVTYQGTVIGVLTGGAGADLTITLNAAASRISVDTLIENLTYANSSDTPTTSRDLVLNVTDASDADLFFPATFAELTGAADPFTGISVGNFSMPSFVDLDGDGDLDLVVGNSFGRLFAYANDAGTYTVLADADNPHSDIEVSLSSLPSFADLDGDGDLDLVVGQGFDLLRTFENTTPFNIPTLGIPLTVVITPENDPIVATDLPTDVIVVEDIASHLDLSALALSDPDNTDIQVVLTASAGTITAADGTGVTVTDSGTAALTLTGTASAIDAYLNIATSIQYTGAADVNGEDAATVTLTGDDGFGVVTLGTVNVDITAVNDPIVATGLPTDVTVLEDTVSSLNLSAISLSDTENDELVVVLTASAGTMVAVDRAGVTVTNSGTATLTLTGPASDIDAYLNFTGNVQYTGATDVDGDDAATVTLTADDGSGVITLGTVNVDIITTDNQAPTLTGLVPSVTFAENTVNTEPQLLDIDVTFDDLENNFVGGTLTMTGILSEDTLSVNNQGILAGEIGLNGRSVTYEGVTIGVLTGGAGDDLTIIFNAAATSVSIDALIQNLTYANSSDTPTAIHDLVLNVSNASGANLGVLSGATTTFAAQPSAINPFGAITNVSHGAPRFVDLDGDGDLDLVVGEFANTLAYINDAGIYTALTDAANPFDAINGGSLADIGAGLATVGIYSSPSFVDLDGDGDLDLVVGAFDGTFLTYTNDAGGVYRANRCRQPV